MGCIRESSNSKRRLTTAKCWELPGLEGELRQLKLEKHRLSDQLLESNRLVEYAGNQRASCRRQVEILKKELAEVTNVAEIKTRECIALLDERECSARELENAEIDIRKLRTRVRTEQTSKNVIQKRLEAEPVLSTSEFLWASIPATVGHNQYYTETFQNVGNALSSGQGWSEGPVKNYFSGKKKLWNMRRSVIFMKSTGLKKQRNIWTRKLTCETLACEWVEHSHFLRWMHCSKP